MERRALVAEKLFGDLAELEEESATLSDLQVQQPDDLIGWLDLLAGGYMAGSLEARPNEGDDPPGAAERLLARGLKFEPDQLGEIDQTDELLALGLALYAWTRHHWEVWGPLLDSPEAANLKLPELRAAAALAAALEDRLEELGAGKATLRVRLLVKKFQKALPDRIRRGPRKHIAEKVVERDPNELKPAPTQVSAEEIDAEEKARARALRQRLIFIFAVTVMAVAGWFGFRDLLLGPQLDPAQQELQELMRTVQMARTPLQRKVALEEVERWHEENKEEN